MGYSLNHFDDNGETKVITDFESRLSLRLVALDQFDTFLQQAAKIKGANSLPLDSFIQSLQSTEFYHTVADFGIENSNLGFILRHSSLKGQGDDEVSVVSLRILGLLLCASTKRMKADLLYNILVGDISHKPSEPSVVVSDGNSEAHASDIFIDPPITKEMLKATAIKMLDISFALMIEAHAAECQRWHDFGLVEHSNPYS